MGPPKDVSPNFRKAEKTSSHPRMRWCFASPSSEPVFMDVIQVSATEIEEVARSERARSTKNGIDNSCTPIVRND